MSNERPVVSATARYSVNEAAALLGVHRNTLLNWTNAHSIKCGVRQNGRKFYTGAEITRIWNYQL